MSETKRFINWSRLTGVPLEVLDAHAQFGGDLADMARRYAEAEAVVKAKKERTV